jgi:hypothetical protein
MLWFELQQVHRSGTTQNPQPQHIEKGWDMDEQGFLYCASAFFMRSSPSRRKCLR